MPYINHCSKLLTVFALSYFLAGLIPEKVIANSETEDPQWLPAWQQITQSQTDSEAVLLMEAFLYAHYRDEDALETIAVPYLLQAGMNIRPQVEALASNNKSPVIRGLLTFLQILEEDDRLLCEQEPRTWAQHLYAVLVHTWHQKNQRQALYGQALRQVSALREQQPDSLTLTWLAAQLHQLKPDGGHWQAERAWEHWTAENPDRDISQTDVYRKTPFVRDSQTTPSPTITKGWHLFGPRGAEALNIGGVKVPSFNTGGVRVPRFNSGFNQERYCDQDGCAQLIAMGSGGVITTAVAAALFRKVIQTGGRKIYPRTAEILNKNLGRKLHPREWGRALERLKGKIKLRGDHHGKIYGNGDYANHAGKVIGNIDDYVP